MSEKILEDDVDYMIPATEELLDKNPSSNYKRKVSNIEIDLETELHFHYKFSMLNDGVSKMN